MKNSNWLTNSIVVCILASICCALWGSAFPFVKMGYNLLGISAGDTPSQILFAGTRFTLAGIMTIIIGSCISRQVLIPTVSSLPKVIKLSLLQTILQYLFFYVGLSHTSGVKASIVQGMNVFVALLVASLIFHQEKLTRRKLLGCLIGFLGVIIVNVNASGISTDIKLVGEGFIFLSTVAYALSSVMLKQYAKTEDTIMLSGYQFIVGGMAMMVIGFVMGGSIGNYSMESVGILIYLALVSAIAYSIWSVLLKHNSISKVAVYGFMTPVFGVLLSALLLHENQILGYRCIIALVLVSVGIFIVNYGKQGKNNV